MIVACLVLTACASTPTQSYTRTSGSGRTLEEAKNNAFREAIQHKVGTVVLSERESDRENILKDDINIYSGGYIDDYKVISNHVTNGKYYVTLDVIVSDSKLANFKLGNKNYPAKFDSNTISSQYTSYMDRELAGDNLISKILAGFPTNAFTINQKPYSIELDKFRNMVIKVPYELRWNYHYIRSFNEAMSKLSDEGSLISPGYSNVITMYKDPNDFVMGTRNHFKFNDYARVQKIQKGLHDYNAPRLRIDIKDQYNNNVFTACWSFQKTFYSTEGRNVVIFGNDVEENYYQVTFRPDQINLVKSINVIHLSITSSKVC